MGLISKKTMSDFHDKNDKDKEVIDNAKQALIRLSKEKDRAEILSINLKTQMVKWLLVFFGLVFISGFYSNYLYNRYREINHQQNVESKNIEMFSPTSSLIIPGYFLLGSILFSGFKVFRMFLLLKTTNKRVEEAKKIYTELSHQISAY